MQIEVGCEAARGTEKPEKLGFVIGFLLGQEAIWLSESLRILREEAPDVEITLMTRSSAELTDGRQTGPAWRALSSCCEVVFLGGCSRSDWAAAPA